MANLNPTIGLEIHAELRTKSKMFCSCPNNPFENHPNVNVCPICLGHPGTLPTINKEAVKLVILTGLALGGKIQEISKFDRKNYFYPDLPKGYQISQYDKPLVVGGNLKGIRIRRIHLEEDTGTLIHSENGSLVDFNRAGVPLMELVTEPDISNAKEAREFCEELQLILRYLNVSSADMEKGEMRLEANISLGMGTKVEVKNINSFKALEQAIEYEINRQLELIKNGKKVVQETRGWDDNLLKTFSQRSKEEAHDYRYFKEPDLPSFETNIFDIDFLKTSLVELPEERRQRFKKEFNLNKSQIEILIKNKLMADFFEQSISELKEFAKDNLQNGIELLYNYLTTDLVGLLKNESLDFEQIDELVIANKINPHKFAHLINLILEGKIISRQAKDILKICFDTGRDPEEVLKTEGLGMVFDEEIIKTTVKEVIEANPQAVLDYKKGKEASLQFLIGESMKRLKGRGNPNLLKEILIELIKSV
jgi:aspartyl-tRNA(Asn)/glutamyl-tRNA(Gln) amidotransferase subunit B